MKIRAHGERVLIRRLDDPATAGSIQIPDDMREEMAGEMGLGRRAVVVSAGEKADLVRPGDTVLLNRLAGARSEIHVAGETLQFVHVKDIEGVF